MAPTLLSPPYPLDPVDDIFRYGKPVALYSIRLIREIKGLILNKVKNQHWVIRFYSLAEYCLDSRNTLEQSPQCSS